MPYLNITHIDPVVSICNYDGLLFNFARGDLRNNLQCFSYANKFVITRAWAPVGTTGHLVYCIGKQQKSNQQTHVLEDGLERRFLERLLYGKLFFQVALQEPLSTLKASGGSLELGKSKEADVIITLQLRLPLFRYPRVARAPVLDPLQVDHASLGTNKVASSIHHFASMVVRRSLLQDRIYTLHE